MPGTGVQESACPTAHDRANGTRAWSKKKGCICAIAEVSSISGGRAKLCSFGAVVKNHTVIHSEQERNVNNRNVAFFVA